ncbi:aminopeptidase P family protein [Marinilabiliaceae bacterium ANBcel2]|nr:aminopeptidase P family protein [Marinilabiliaceae bacterium ANBcel2]
MQQVSDKLIELRNKMDIHGIDACIIPSEDPHLSEYPSQHWKIREWISDFTGSAGTVVVTAEEAGLWVDSRYHLQAEKELDQSCINLFKSGEKDIPSYEEWLISTLTPGSKIGIDGRCFSISKLRSLTRKFRTAGIKIDPAITISEEIWDARPPIPEDTVFMHDEKYVGSSRSKKIHAVRKSMKRNNVSHYITVSLDEIAWLLNLRGKDVPYNPLFHAFLIIDYDQIKLFINPHKLTAQIAQKLIVDEVKVYTYEDFYLHLADISEDAIIYIDPERINSAVYSTIPQRTTKKEGISIIADLKSQKNRIEVENFKSTLIKDGVAMIKFLMWIEDNFKSENITEYSAVKKLKQIRAQNSEFKGESFATISAYAENGALAHYKAEKSNSAVLKEGSLFLIDSGGQYPGGTTDITRTIPLGEIPEEAKVDYTLVLKGHISLASASFPNGTRGCHLDILARKSMWEYGINYGHGTGHGIGYFLNVHEGPQSIRPEDNGIQFKPGMITSNEPGIYRAGKYGIRIENLILCKETEETDFGQFLEFETLTICPIETSIIKKELMTTTEILWLNSYHTKVNELLSPHLSNEEKIWLEKKTKQL